jgi:hypothetical protein
MTYLIIAQGDFGPFEPYIPTSVPLWLAVTLKKKEKCSIEIPEWLSVGMMVLSYIYPDTELIVAQNTWRRDLKMNVLAVILRRFLITIWKLHLHC